MNGRCRFFNHSTLWRYNHFVIILIHNLRIYYKIHFLFEWNRFAIVGNPLSIFIQFLASFYNLVRNRFYTRMFVFSRNLHLETFGRNQDIAFIRCCYILCAIQIGQCDRTFRIDNIFKQGTKRLVFSYGINKCFLFRENFIAGIVPAGKFITFLFGCRQFQFKSGIHIVMIWLFCRIRLALGSQCIFTTMYRTTFRY